MFAQCWEDPACDLRALRPTPGDTIVAITSGGDNVLGLLLADPAAVISLDVNPAQTWLMQLKIAAFRQLTHGEVLELFGVRKPTRTEELYARLRGDLPAAAREHWDHQSVSLRRGLLTCGRFEEYFALVRAVLRWSIGRTRLERLFELELREQREFYRTEWNNRRWRAVLRVLCSRTMLGRSLDPSWFEHGTAGNRLGEHFTRLAEHALVDLPVRSNYFLAQMLLGRYVDERTVPAYLQPEHFEVLRARLDRVQVITADINDALASLPPASVDAFALSNVFEYGPREAFARGRAEIRRAARAGARISLRNLLADRSLADEPAFAVDEPLSAHLQLEDRGFIYARFQAAVVRGAPGGAA